MHVKDSSIEKKNKRICKFFLSGSCAYGEFCRFLHVAPVETSSTSNVGSAEAQSSEIITSEKAPENQTVEESYGDGQTKEQTSSLQLKAQKAACRYYARGYCGRGKKCPFLHERRIVHKFKKTNDISGNNETPTDLTETSQQPPTNTTTRNVGVKNFSNDRKSYMRQFFVPKGVRESQRRFIPNANVEKSPEELRRTELEMLEKKFPEAERTDGESGATFRFGFVPTDPDWVS